jgi:hypothetical protein
VLAALAEVRPGVEIALWTSVPRWFFAESLGFPFEYRELACDVGLAQKNALEEDLPATLARLEELWSGAQGDGSRGREVAEGLAASGASAVLCDISPLGLVAAREAGLPSILLENFTWDWIYEGLAKEEPRFARWVELLRESFALADLRLQAEPVCRPVAGAVVVPPIARRPRSTPSEVRARLGIAPQSSMILVSFGGVEGALADPRGWRIPDGVEVVVPGGAPREERVGRLVLLPHHTPLFHPDLVASADLVAGKLGYSTVAEVVAAGNRLLYLDRPAFRESAVLESFVRERLPSARITLDELRDGRWLERAGELLAAPRPAGLAAAGAERAAGIVAARLDAAR